MSQDAIDQLTVYAAGLAQLVKVTARNASDGLELEAAKRNPAEVDQDRQQRAELLRLIGVNTNSEAACRAFAIGVLTQSSKQNEAVTALLLQAAIEGGRFG